MTFLNPSFLYALPLALLPVIIHLFSWRKKIFIDFSTIRFLKQLEQKRIKTVKLKQIILLILRTLIITLIVLAFSRPAIKTLGFKFHSKTTALLIVDNSFSTHARFEREPVFNIIKDKAREVLTSFSDGDELYIVPLCNKMENNRANPVYTLNNAYDLLSDIRLSYDYGSFTDLLHNFTGILNESKNLNKEVYYISDLQKTGLKDNLPESEENVKRNLYFIDASPGNLDNSAVTDIVQENQILEKGKKIAIQVTIRNYSSSEKSDVFTSVFLGGERVAHQTVNIDPYSREILHFKNILENSGFLENSIEIEDDALIEDNRRNFCLYVPENINILYIRDAPPNPDYLKLALQPESKATNLISITEHTHAEITNTDFNEFDIVIYCGFPVLSEQETYRIKNFLDKGGCILLIPDNESDLSSYNQNLSNIFNIAKIVQTRGEKGKWENFLTLGKLDLTHPLFQGIFQEENTSIDMPHFFFTLSFEKKQNEEKIMEFSNGAPFILESKTNNGSIILLATALDLQWTDLPLKGIFVPLINRLILYMATAESQTKQNYTVGEEILFSTKKDYKNLRIEKPDGSLVKLMPVISGDNIFVRFNDTDEPGFYRLYSDKRLLYVFPFNNNNKESDLRKIEENELKEKFKSDNVITASYADNVNKIISESRYGEELAKYLILTILLLLAAEMIISNERNRGEK